MAWNTIPVSKGALVKAGDVGTWLGEVKTQAATIANNHCPGNYSGYKGTHFNSNNSNNSQGSFDENHQRFNCFNEVFKSGGNVYGC